LPLKWFHWVFLSCLDQNCICWTPVPWYCNWMTWNIAQMCLDHIPHRSNNSFGIQYNKVLNYAIFWPFLTKERTFLALYPGFTTNWAEIWHRSALHICANWTFGIQYKRMLNFVILWPFLPKKHFWLLCTADFTTKWAKLWYRCAIFLFKWPMYDFCHGFMAV